MPDTTTTDVAEVPSVADLLDRLTAAEQTEANARGAEATAQKTLGDAIAAADWAAAGKAQRQLTDTRTALTEAIAATAEAQRQAETADPVTAAAVRQAQAQRRHAHYQQLARDAAASAARHLAQAGDGLNQARGAITAAVAAERQAGEHTAQAWSALQAAGADPRMILDPARHTEIPTPVADAIRRDGILTQLINGRIL